MANIIKYRERHYYCEDRWFSCPMDPDGCANESQPQICTCGADKVNAYLDELDEKLQRIVMIAEEAQNDLEITLAIGVLADYSLQDIYKLALSLKDIKLEE